jgi:hypothetical protein
MLKEESEDDEEDKTGIAAKLWKSGCWCCWGAYETKDAILFFFLCTSKEPGSLDFQPRTRARSADKFRLRLFLKRQILPKLNK